MSKHVAVEADMRKIHRLISEQEVEGRAMIHMATLNHIHRGSFQPSDSQDPLKAYAKKAEEVVKNPISA